MTRRFVLVAVFILAACQSQRSAQVPAVQPPPPPATALNPSTPVAKMGGKTITAGELDDSLKKDIKKAENEYQERMYQMRRQGLESMVIQRLLEAKAKDQGVTSEELVKKEVTDKIPDPPAAEISAVYDKAKASGRQLPPLEQVKPDIVRFLKSQKSEEAMRSFFDKLKADAKVEMLLPTYVPPKIEVAAVGPSKGESAAPITIVEFSDFECPFCGRVEPTIEKVMTDYKGKVRLVYRDFPLAFHPKAQKASEAALCAEDQGKYWEMHHQLFTHQQALDVEQLKGHAKELKLDQDKFEKCLASGEKAKVIDVSKKVGEEAGVTGTPAFFINGRMISGAQPYEKFKELIDTELAQK